MGTDQDLSGYVPHIQACLDLYEMNTPLRIAAFLAQGTTIVFISSLFNGFQQGLKN